MTKPVVGVAMMMLYEEGKYQLNAPVSKFIPGFAALEVYTGEGSDGVMEPAPLARGRRITMRDLMKHTAGLGYVLNPRHPVTRAFQQTAVLVQRPQARDAARPHRRVHRQLAVGRRRVDRRRRAAARQ